MPVHSRSRTLFERAKKGVIKTRTLRWNYGNKPIKCSFKRWKPKTLWPVSFHSIFPCRFFWKRLINLKLFPTFFSLMPLVLSLEESPIALCVFFHHFSWTAVLPACRCFSYHFINFISQRSASARLKNNLRNFLFAILVGREKQSQSRKRCVCVFFSAVAHRNLSQFFGLLCKLRREVKSLANIDFNLQFQLKTNFRICHTKRYGE